MFTITCATGWCSPWNVQPDNVHHWMCNRIMFTIKCYLHMKGLAPMLATNCTQRGMPKCEKYKCVSDNILVWAGRLKWSGKFVWMERVDGGQLGRTALAPSKYKYKYKCKYKYHRDINLRYRYLRHRTLRGVDVGNLPNEYFRDRTLKGVGCTGVAVSR